MKTSQYIFGSSQLFDCDDYSSDIMRNLCPQPTIPEECNLLFNRTGEMLNNVFSYAHRLGIKTCVGTEIPLTVPETIRKPIKTEGKKISDSDVIKELYEGIFTRIKRAYSIDYYWLWTPENWTWKGASETEISSTCKDLLAAVTAKEKIKAPFQLATCGWVLGPPNNLTIFDVMLPKNVSFSCLNRNVGFSPVEITFGKILGRAKWAIPWLEDDPALTSPQLWVKRMHRDATDALKYGCTGLIGIHWRTRILDQNISALAHLGWSRQFNLSDFYYNYALRQFGPEAAAEIASILARVDRDPSLPASKDDNSLPRPSEWVDGPGGLRPDPLPWKDVSKKYAFVSELEALRPKIKGVGNLERFMYWLNQFYYMREMAHVRCLWAEFNKAMNFAKAEADSKMAVASVKERVLPLRKQLVKIVHKTFNYLLLTVSTPGELGTVANWNQHIAPSLLTEPGRELAKILGEELPSEAQPSMDYDGPVHVIVPTLRSSIDAEERVTLKIIALAAKPVKSVVIHWRPLGKGKWRDIPGECVARTVYKATLPEPGDELAIEYFVSVIDDEGNEHFAPATGRDLPYSMVVNP